MTVARPPAGSGNGTAVSTLQLRSVAEIERLPPPAFLLDGILPERSLCEIHGPPGVGKSFLALDIALCVATGRPFLGRQVDRAPVVYVAAEGSYGIGARTKAWRHARAVTDVVDAYLLTEPVQLLDPRSVQRFVAGVTEQLHELPGLVVMDTLARCLAGGDENSAQDMGLVVAALDRIRADLDCAVLLLHHTRKDGETERGSSALRGAVDTMIGVKGEDGQIRMICEKQKDAAPFETIRLQITPLLDSCVIGTISDVVPISGHLTNLQRDLLQALHLGFPDGEASTSAWKEAAGMAHTSFHRTRTALVRAAYVDHLKVGRSSINRITSAGELAIGAKYQRGANKVPGTSNGLVPPTSPPLGGSGNGTYRRPDELELLDELDDERRRGG